MRSQVFSIFFDIETLANDCLMSGGPYGPGGILSKFEGGGSQKPILGETDLFSGSTGASKAILGENSILAPG